MIIDILLGFFVLLAIFLIVVTLQPTNFRITRSATLPAPPATVFAEVNDFHRWEAWSPWARLDPHANNSYAGMSSGEGAMFSWEGNNKVGAGRMTLIDSHPDELIRIKLEFFKPFEAVHTSEFTFAPADAGTLVTWTMSGKNSFLAKAMTLVMNCDKMVGGQFEKGLDNLRAVVAAP